MNPRRTTAYRGTTEPTGEPPGDAARHAAAVETLAGVAWRFFVTPRQLRASVVEVVSTGYAYARALHTIERREIVLRVEPSAGRDDAHSPLPDPTAVDPWTADPDELPSSSACLCRCERCRGSGEADCVCGGTKTRPCDECGGTGHVAGQRSNTKQCPRCRARGTRRCTECVKGIAACAQCAGRGQVRAWLQLRVRRLSQVRAHPKAATSTHSRLLEAGDFDAGTWPFELVDDDMTQLDADLELELRADIDVRTDRVVSSRVQTFDARAVRVTYATKHATGKVVLVGEPLRFAARPSLRPMIWRQHAVLGVLAGGGILATGIWTAYAVRHEFYRRFGHGGLVFLAALLTGVLAAVVASHSAEVLEAGPLEARARVFRAPWYSPAASAPVRELLSKDAREQARRAYHAKQLGVLHAVRNAIGGIDPGVDRELDGLASLLAARDCIDRGHFDCALTAVERAAREPSIEAERSVVEQLFSTELRRELDAKVAAGRSAGRAKLDRVRSYERAIELGVVREKRGDLETSPPLATLRAEFAAVLVAAQAEEKIAAQREAAQRAAERRAAAEAARDANRPLLCCDGVRSPTCTSGGSRRGCCSHHGGVCGVGR